MMNLILLLLVMHLTWGFPLCSRHVKHYCFSEKSFLLFSATANQKNLTAFQFPAQTTTAILFGDVPGEQQCQTVEHFLEIETPVHADGEAG